MIRSSKCTVVGWVLGLGMVSACGAGPQREDHSAEGTGGIGTGLPHMGDEDGAGGGDGEVGAVGGSSGSGGTVPAGTSCEQVGVNVGANVLRRLSKLEYQLTLQDLFQLPHPPNVDLVPEDVEHEGFSSFSALQNLTAAHLRAYIDTAAPLAQDFVGDSTRLGDLAGCAPTAAGCLSDFTKRLGRLAFRRDLSQAELDRLVQNAQQHASSELDQFAYVMESLLIAPEFLFRVEVGDQAEGISTLSAAELAAKLSFTLWGRAPSAELLDRAAAGELGTMTGLTAVAADMLEHEHARYFYQQFFRQWLGYSKLRAPIDPPADWSDELMPDMTAETDHLVSEYAWGGEHHFLDLLIANRTTVSPRLAAYYGDSTSPRAGGAQVVVEHDPEDPRAQAGALGHAALLSQKTDGDKVSVRGNWLRSTFLCESLELPAGLSDILGEQLVGLTSMEIIAHRNQEPGCKKCHSAIDPIGVGLAVFDASGRFDASVALADYPLAPAFPDAEDPHFSSLADLAAKLRAMSRVPECLAERVFVYAEGRHAEPEDVCTSEAASAGFSHEQGSFQGLLRHLVQSPGFRLRRAPSPTP